MAGARGQRLKRPPAVARVLERVTATARKHEMFLPGETVLVACSGGPDSVCLLHALHRLRRLFRIRIEVFHLDHALRPDSGKDAEYVKRQADRLKVPFHLVVATSKPERGDSVEAWARTVRLRAMTSVLMDIEAHRMAEGHTVDDQAETVLIALIRGGGLDALAGIHPVRAKAVAPLLEVTRAEAQAFCRSLGLRPRIDPMNRDTRLLRNAVRLKGIPALERAAGRELRGTFARTADLLRIDQKELFHQAVAASNELVEETPTGCEIAASPLLSLPLALRSRVVRAAFVLARAPWTEDAIQAVLDLAAGRPGRKRDLPGGLKAARGRKYVRLVRPSPQRTSSRKGKT